MKRICVFCGSSVGRDPVYQHAARALGDALVDRGLGLVYGGAQRGLMGVIANQVLARGGEVIGVIPERMVEAELAHPGVTELLVVPGMHERKATMAARSDGFIAMPGGFGTLEELTEVVTWSQLGLHHKPFGVYNVAGYFDAFLQFGRHMVDAGFLKPAHFEMLRVSSDPGVLIELLGLPDID
jgi:uncharacterized protein (TIGR00730 family)